MGDKTGIEWTDATWNPVTGCTKVSQGCKHCYAERVFPRAYARDVHQYDNGHGVTIVRARRFTDVKVHPDRLDVPLRWKRPRRIFVNSMSDLFHEDVSASFIAQVYAVMRMAPQHTFQVLTKRPARMLDVVTSAPEMPRDVLPNVWLGVSVEDQATADERIILLRQTPAAVRWISAEPLLGPVNISRHLWPVHWHWDARYKTPEAAIAAGAHAEQKRQALVGAPASFLDWVVVGGESGPGARDFDLAWARSLVEQCRNAGIPVLVKQLGARPVWSDDDDSEPPHWGRIALRDRKGGDMAEWPEDLRVREYPT